MSLEKRLKHVEDDIHLLTKDLLELIVYLREKEETLPMPDGTVARRRSEPESAFLNRLLDAQRHYIDSTNPKHPNFDPDMSEYYRGKAHGIKLAMDLVADYMKNG